MWAVGNKWMRFVGGKKLWMSCCKTHCKPQNTNTAGQQEVKCEDCHYNYVTYQWKGADIRIDLGVKQLTVDVYVIFFSLRGNKWRAASSFCHVYDNHLHEADRNEYLCKTCTVSLFLDIFGE